MKITGNCRCFNDRNRADCPYLRHPYYHSGYTGKSGPETWFMCVKHKAAVRNLKRCYLAGAPDKQQEDWIETHQG